MDSLCRGFAAHPAATDRLTVQVPAPESDRRMRSQLNHASRQVGMELLSRSDAAMRLGVTLDEVDQGIEDGELFAVRFATGIRVMLDTGNRAPSNESTRSARRTPQR